MQDKEPNPEYMQPSAKMLEKLLQMPCGSCGSELTYSAEKRMLECKHCGFTQDYEKANDMIRELSLSQAASQAQHYTPASIGRQVVECESCRSQLMIEEKDVTVRCNFCGSDKVNKAAFSNNLIQPQGIIPFEVTKREAADKFKVWIAEGWFRPNKLKRLASLGAVQGIYLPFWTFDSDTYSDWKGEAGHHYYVEVERNGKMERERRTRWEWKSGSFERKFDDVLIVAAKGVTRSVVESIYPYQLNKSVNYNPTLMVGWQAEIYTIDLPEGYQLAETDMREDIRKQASKALGGDEQRGLRVNSEFYNQTFKHLILPVFLCTYEYGGKMYQFAVNGQTGKIEGQKPISWVKVFFFVLFIAAIIGTIVYFANSGDAAPTNQ